MKFFVLIPGAWTGGWIWEPVAQGLHARGHDVYPVTLPGLERQNVDTSRIGLDTHVEAVLSVITERDLRDVVVVGHGTSGVIAGIVADRAPERVIHTVYLEAFLPHNGRSALDAFPEPVRSEELRSIAENGGRWPTPVAAAVAEGQGLSAEKAAWLTGAMVDHPGRPLTEPVRLIRPLAAQRATYVVCLLDHIDGRLSDEVKRMRTAPRWTFRTLESGVWPMVSMPEEVVALLDRTASEPGHPAMPTLGSGLPSSAPPSSRPGVG